MTLHNDGKLEIIGEEKKSAGFEPRPLDHKASVLPLRCATTAANVRAEVYNQSQGLELYMSDSK